jgi:UDP-N-acetyl-2-amino-2-deoxyglucuronate dehydrogenase
MGKGEVRVGLVGTGSIAGFHAAAIADVPDARLVAATSRREEPGKDFARKHGCDFEPSLEALLARDDIDAVAITTPSGSHAEIGIAAARAGKHVFCEKPLDITPEKIDALIQACDEAKVQLGAVFQSRMGNSGRALKEAIEQNRFGKLSQCSAYVPWYRTDEYYSSVGWRGTWELDGGGALMNQGIHAVDMLLWVAGDVEEVSACCQTRLHDIEVEDNAVAWLRFTSGALGVIQASTCSFPGQAKRLEIMGEKGTVVMEDDLFKVWKFSDESPQDAEKVNPPQQSGIGGGASDPKAISTEGHRRLYVDFVEAVLSGRASLITGAEARRAVELICAIYQSSREGKPVKLR